MLRIFKLFFFDLRNGINMISLFLVTLPVFSQDTPAAFFVQPVNPSICKGKSIILSVNGGNEVTWSPAYGLHSTTGTTVTAQPDSTTTYTVTAKNAEGQTSVARVTVTVSIHPPESELSFSEVADNICLKKNYQVKVKPIPGASEYYWSAPEGTFFNGKPSPVMTRQAAVELRVDYLVPGKAGFNLCVFASNSCGRTPPLCKWINSSIPKPQFDTTLLIVCPSGTLSIPLKPHADAKRFLFTCGTGLAFPNNDTSFTTVAATARITAAASFNKGFVCAIAENECGIRSQAQCIDVISSPENPNEILGEKFVCPGDEAEYTINPVAGAFRYDWTVSDSSISFNVSSTQVKIKMPEKDFAPIKLCVKPKNNCNNHNKPLCTSIESKLPAMPQSVTGDITGCCGEQGAAFHAAPSALASHYRWWSDDSLSFEGSNRLSTVLVNFPELFDTLRVFVAAANECGESAAKMVSALAVPASPMPVIGETIACPGSIQNYFTEGSRGATSYNWSLMQGAILLGDTLTKEAIIRFGNNSGFLKVTAANPCGNSLPVYQYIKLNCYLRQILDSSTGR